MLTPGGRGAVATIRIEGDLSALESAVSPLFLASKGRPVSLLEVGAIHFGRWENEHGEGIVATRHSEQMMELHCHGGQAAVTRILSDLEGVGCSIVSWQSQMMAAENALEAECLEALSRATTWRTAEILLQQSEGLLKQTFLSLVSVTALSATQTCGRGALVSTERDTLRHHALHVLDDLLALSEFGLHLTRPWRVVLSGPPNVGKSSLINRLLGYDRAIVFDQPGTTRDVLTAETAFEGWPLLLIDTAGLRDTTEDLEAAGIALARQQLRSCDLPLILIDLGLEPTPEDKALIEQWPNAILVAHKCDQPDRWRQHLPQTAIRVSSLTGQGILELQRQIAERLVPIPPPQGVPIPISIRQVGLLQAARKGLTESNTQKYDESLRMLIQGGASTTLADGVRQAACSATG